MMKKFPKVVLKQVGMSPYLLCLDVVPMLFVRGASFLLQDVFCILSFVICIEY